MKFHYQARTQDGELQVGLVEAASREAAINILSSHNLFILSLEPAEKRSWLEHLAGFLNGVSVKDLMIFTRQFAALLSAKIPLAQSLRTLERQTRHPILKSTAFEIASDVDAGLSLSQSLEKYSELFSPFYINLIRSAEVTGRMEEAVNYLADYLEKEVVLINKVRNALIYPSVVVVLFLIVVLIMAIVVLPNIEPIFLESGVPIPAFTQGVLMVGKFLAKWWWAALLVILTSVFLIADYLKTAEGRAVRDELVLRLPVFGNLLKQLYVARFAESASVLIKGGIPITQTLEIASITVGTTVYRDLLHEVAEEVRRGGLVSQALAKKENFFPPLVAQMVAVGESTGRLEELLERVSSFYLKEVDALLNNLVELIQPVLMLIIGVLVGALFAPILVSIYNLLKTF